MVIIMPGLKVKVISVLAHHESGLLMTSVNSRETRAVTFTIPSVTGSRRQPFLFMLTHNQQLHHSMLIIERGAYIIIARKSPSISTDAHTALGTLSHDKS